MKLRIKKMVLDSFKGIRHAEYDFNSDRIEFQGPNGSGKTTIATAHTWLWTDKSYDLVANPELHPIFMEESAPSVAETIEVDGVEIEIRKVQEDGRTKKEKDSQAPIKIKNTFTINSVPKSQRDFIKELESRDIYIDDFLLLSHPEIFVSQKTADCRKLLFAMSSSESDKDIADSMPDCKELAARLEARTVEELECEAKATKKKLTARLDVIPNEIIGLERSIIDIDIDSLNKKKSELSLKLSDAQKNLDNIPSLTRDAVNLKISEIRNHQQDITQSVNKSRMETIYKRQSEYDTLARQYERQRMLTTGMESDLEKVNDEIRSEQMKKAELDENFRKYKDSKFSESKKVCPTCGQPLPADKIAEAKATFEKKKEDFLNGLAHDSTTRENKISFLHGQMQDLTKSLTESRQLEKSLEAKCDKAKKDLDDAKAIPEESGVSSPEYKKLEDEIANLNMELKEVDKADSERVRINEEIMRLQAEVHEIDCELAKSSVNERTRGLIAELTEEQKQSAQSLANAEQILFQISTLNMEKNKRLEDSVNAKFPDFVKFRLFKYQKNGEIRDDCEPYLLDGDTWKSFSQSSNTGLQTLGKMGILAGLQNYYEQSLPIFLDGAESLDSITRSLITNDTQVIFLTVTDGNKLELISM